MALTTAADVANVLRWSAAENTKYASQLDEYVDAASEAIEAEYGPFDAVTVTHKADGGASVALPSRVNAVSSVTVDGVATTAYTVDLNAGIVYGPFTAGRQNVTVVYTAGDAEIPASVALAAAMLAAHLWQVGSQRTADVETGYLTVPSGFAWPNRVRELLEQFATMPGFA